MRPPIPRSKMGKRQRRELDSRGRLTWGICPVTRKAESKKVYSRKKKRRDEISDFVTAFL